MTKIVLDKTGKISVEINRINDFSEYIKNFGFFLFPVKGKEIFSVRHRRYRDDHLFSVPKRMRDYPDECSIDYTSQIKHPTYGECLKKADGWNHKVKNGYFRELYRTKYLEPFYKRNESISD